MGRRPDAGAAGARGGAERTQRLLDVLKSPVRREILWMVWDRELPAGAFVEAFDLGAATISGHLKVLRDAGLVVMRAEALSLLC